MKKGEKMNKQTYNITIGDKIVYSGLDLFTAQNKCRLLLALSSRLDIFYNKEVL